MSAAREVLDELFRRAGRQDLDGVLDLWHDEGVLEDVTLGRRLIGKHAVTAYLHEFFAALPDLTYAPQQLVVEDDRGVVVWESRTRVARPFFGFPPTETSIPLRGVDVFLVRDERVLQEWSWYGDAWLAQRLAGDRPLAHEPPAQP